MSQITIKYKSLTFLDYPDYRVGTDGSIWTRRRRGKSKINDVITVQLRWRFRKGDISIRELAEQFSLSKRLVWNVVMRKWRSRLFWRRVLPQKNKGGYLSVRLFNGGDRCKYFFVHHLVLLAFVGPKPAEDFQCRHFPDSNPSNNNVENLSWGSRSENAQDKFIHGTANEGSKSSTAKLIELEVSEIRKLHRVNHISRKQLAEMFDVSQSTIDKIINHETWKQLV